MPILAQDFEDILLATQDLWDYKDMGNIPAWRAYAANGQGPQLGRPIYAQDLLDLRYWINLYELSGDSPPSLNDPSRHGVSTRTYDTSDNLTLGDSWITAITALGVKWVRVTINAAAGNIVRSSTSDPLLSYVAVLTRLKSAGLNVLAVLTSDTDTTTGYDDVLTTDPDTCLKSNSYINHFVNTQLPPIIAAFQATTTRLALVDAYEIWNEPNDPNGARMHSDRLGALLYFCKLAIPYPQQVVTGGILYNDGWDANYLTGSGGDDP